MTARIHCTNLFQVNHVRKRPWKERQVSMPFKPTLLIILVASLWSASGSAYDCTGLPEWKRQHYYLFGDQVQFMGFAYENRAEASKRDRPDQGDPWVLLGPCDPPDDGGGNGDTGEPVDPQPLSIFGVWHCGNTFCDWSQERTPEEFAAANGWLFDRDGNPGTPGDPAVNLVVLSFLQPLALLQGRTDNAFEAGIPVGMTPELVAYIKDRDIRVLLSVGGVTYTDFWNEALVTDPASLAEAAVNAVSHLGADGLEIDWENGRPDAAQLAGIETFIETYNTLADATLPETVLTLDLAVGNRYLQELSRRAAADWLPSGKIDYINAMVPRGDPDTDQWQEHIDGKSQYDPPILPKAPAKVAVSLWLTDSRRPNANCVDFSASSLLATSDYVQTVLANGAGSSHGMLGYMLWAGECPSSRNVCTSPPNTCEGGMGAAADYFQIQPLDFSLLRQE